MRLIPRIFNASKNDIHVHVHVMEMDTFLYVDNVDVFYVYKFTAIIMLKKFRLEICTS